MPRRPAAPTATAAASQPQPVPMAGVAIEIATQALAGKNRFEIRLDPPELGRIDVRLDVDKDGNVTSKLIVERAETLDLLRRDAQQLERALQQAGLKTSDSALQFSLRDQDAERDGDQPSQRGGRDSESDETTPAIDARRHRATLRAGGLDISI
jgi:flagellar hook-length control protein FliK